MLFRTFCFIAALSIAANGFASDPSENSNSYIFESTAETQHDEPVKLQLLIEDSAIEAGLPFTVAVKMTMAEGWHSYWKNPGEAGMPTQINWTLPPGFTTGEVQWPTPTKFELGGLVSYGYEGEIYFLTEITPPKEFTPGTPVKLEASARWLACSDSMCLPGEQEIALELPIALNPDTAAQFTKARAALFPTDPKEIEKLGLPPSPASDSPLLGLADEQETGAIDPATLQGAPSDLDGNLMLAFLFAFIGGLLLNLMPCVLPVISLKILSFVKMSGENRSSTLKHGLAFFGGVIASFWVLAGSMLLLQSYGHSIGWGFQLQEPIFVALLAALLLLFALNFFSVFEMGTSLTSLAGQAQQSSKLKKSGLFGSFCSGILATAVATPCSGPFLGSAIGFAVTLPPILALAIFTVLGAGMALPYLLLSAFPSLLRFLPKPGAWMGTFKQLMGFAMLATVLWLLWVFAAQTGNFALFLLLFALLVVAFAAWVYGHFCTILHSKLSQRIGLIVSAFLLGLSVYTIVLASSTALVETGTSSAAIASADEEWESFSPRRVEELQRQGTPVLIDFTAKWCLICQVNHLVLSSPQVSQKLKELNIVKMKADWTRRDPAITEALQKFGRNAVPLYVLTRKDAGETPHILPQVLTPEIVIDFLNQL